MRPCSCARRPTDAHMSSRTHPRTPTYIHPCTRTYARIRAREEVFWQQICFTALPNRVPSSVRHHSFILSNRCIIRIHIDATLAAPSVQTVIICHSFSTNLPFIITHLHQSPNYLPFIHLSLISYSFPISSYLSTISHASYSIFIRFPFQPTDHPINMSVCYKSLSILYILSALPYTAVSHLIQISISINPTIIILIMETVFRANHQKFPLCIIIHPKCIIIHLNCINIHLYDFHYGNHLLIIGFYYKNHLWDFILSSAYMRARVYMAQKITAPFNGVVSRFVHLK